MVPSFQKYELRRSTNFAPPKPPTQTAELGVVISGPYLYVFDVLLSGALLHL